MQWLDDVLASVPEDFTVEEQPLPPDAVIKGNLPDDFVPVVRAWMYTQERILDVRKSGIRSSARVLTNVMCDEPIDRAAASRELEAIMSVVRRLELQEKALRALLEATLWDRFATPEDDSLGIAWNCNAWVVFSAPDDRPDVTLAALVALPR